eukprot:364963-Chlamydomonas_euryale.AAC.9
MAYITHAQGVTHFGAIWWRGAACSRRAVNNEGRGGQLLTRSLVGNAKDGDEAKRGAGGPTAAAAAATARTPTPMLQALSIVPAVVFYTALARLGRQCLLHW